jgi:hypothetical protein
MSALADLARAIQVTDRQRRIRGNDVILLAGLYGTVRPATDGVPILSFKRGPLDWRLIEELIDAGVISKIYGAETFRLRRMPSTQGERHTFRSLVGLLRAKEIVQ